VHDAFKNSLSKACAVSIRSQWKALIILVTFLVAEITTTPFRIIASEYKML